MPAAIQRRTSTSRNPAPLQTQAHRPHGLHHGQCRAAAAIPSERGDARRSPHAPQPQISACASSVGPPAFLTRQAAFGADDAPTRRPALRTQPRHPIGEALSQFGDDGHARGIAVRTHVRLHEGERVLGLARARRNRLCKRRGAPLRKLGAAPGVDRFGRTISPWLGKLARDRKSVNASAQAAVVC